MVITTFRIQSRRLYRVPNFSTIYHAAVDPDGDLMDLGYDFDLDGTIDYQLTNYRGIDGSDLTSNSRWERTEFVEHWK